MHLPLLLLSGLLCLALPVLGGFALRRPAGVEPRAALALIGGGALVFLASQLVHVPLNLGVGQLFAAGILPSPSVEATRWLLPFGLGLSAALCEEPARWVYFRWRTAAGPWTWGRGLLVGLGHGGVEAVLVGLTVLSSAAGLLYVRVRGIEALGLPPEQAALVAGKLAEVEGQPAVMMLMAAGERAMAMSCHLAMSLLVMRAVRERRPRWLLASIALHTLLNAGAVALVQAGWPLGAEAFVLLVALGSLGLVAALRERS